MKRNFLKYYPFIPLLLLCLFYTYKAVDFPIHDFSNYYFGGKFLADGNFDFKMYFPYHFNKAISDLGYQNVFVSYAPNTPFLGMFFAPFSLLSAATAKLVFNCISIGLFLFSIFRLFSFYNINPKFALLIPVLFLIPIKNNLLFGQVYFLLFFLLSEGWIAHAKQHWKSMAFFWGLAILLKIFPMLLIVFLLFKKQWKPIAYLMLSCLAFFGIALIFTGIDIWFFFVKIVLPKASNGEIAGAFVDNYQSVLMFLKRLLVYDAVENQHPVFRGSGYFPIAVMAFKIACIAMGYFVAQKSKNTLAIFSFWIIAMLMLSPYGSTYTLILMVFPLVALLGSEVSMVKKVIASVILFLVCNLPLSVFMGNDFPFSYLRLCFLSVFFTAFVVVLFRKSALIKAIVVGILLFFIGTFFEQAPPDKSQMVLSGRSPILIYDYKISNNQLTYYYWNEKGENQASIPFQCTTAKELDIKENQIVSKARIVTSDANHKTKPKLIDNKTVLYLSDYGRGIGFYTLRKIELSTISK